MQQHENNNRQEIVRCTSPWLFKAMTALSLSILSLGAGICFLGVSTPVNSADLVVPATLKLGSKGTDVSKLQAALKLLGYYNGEVDGIYGETTVEAVSKFQQAAGLTADGIAGETTWKRLFPTHAIASTPKPSPSPTSPTPKPSPSANPPTPKPSPSPTPSQPQPSPSSVPITTPPPETVLPANADLPILRLGMRGAAVTALQQRLKALGFFSAKIDGVFGAKTEIAVKEAQNKFKIQADGIVGKATWAAILR